MELKNFVARVAGGEIVPGATYYVYLADTLTLATIYDKDGIAIANPGAASASGQITFAAVDGDYDLRVTDGATLDNKIRVRFIEPSVSEIFTAINSDFAKLNQVIGGINNNLSCVITGDSLSFNGFDYGGPFTGLVNGAGYATANPFGLQSWAHMIRDLWVSSNPAYQPIAEINKYTNCSAVYGPDSVDLPKLGMNVRALNYYFGTTSQVLNLKNRYVGTSSLIVSYAPASEAVLFVVNGTEYNNTSPDGHYQNRGYMLVPASGDVSITNVRKVSDGTPGALWVYGITSSGGIIPKLTGKGGWTSGQILAEYSTLVAPYSPDVVFYIIGANDIDQGVPVTAFKQNVNDFVDSVRASKPDAIVMLISTPPASSYTKNTALPYIIAGKEIAQAKSCSFVDLWAALENVDPSYYRYDNIHFSKAGDGLVFNVIKKLLLPNVPINQRGLVPQREAYMGFGTTEASLPPEDFSVTYLLGATPTVAITSNSLASSAVKVEYDTVSSVNVLSITAPLGFSVSGVLPMIFDAPYGRTIKQLSYGVPGEILLYLSNGDTMLNITGCGLYVTAHFCRDMSVAV